MASDSLIRTSADELFDLVNKSSKISVEDAAKQLKMPLATVQALVDFLVEERIFGIEYKFTTPYIYLYRESIQKVKSKDDSFTKGLITKEQFYEKAKERNTATCASSFLPFAFCFTLFSAVHTPPPASVPPGWAAPDSPG